VTRRVLVTGGASGIGRAIVEYFRQEEAQIAICDADPAAVEEFRKTHPDAIAEVCDVRNEAQMEAFLAKVEEAWGGADVVCANAGTGGPAGRIEELDYQAWQDCVGVNLFGAFLTCRWAAKVMKAQGSGVIAITSSTSGMFGVPYRSPYVAAKWGLVGLMKTLAMELGPFGIRVNAVAPGAVEGPRMERVLEMEAAADGRDIEEVRELYAAGTSMRTWVSGEDIAQMVGFLASDAASKVSGQLMAVDGHTERMT